MNKIITTSLAFATISFIAVLITSPVSAQNPITNTQISSEMNDNKLKTGKFVKKRYSINGNWSVKKHEGQTLITFDESFKTKGGPDLKLYLSPKSVETLASDTAETGSIKIGVLKSNRGSQTYTLPLDIDLTQYKSLIIHCEAFSVLWGGFDLTE